MKSRTIAEHIIEGEKMLKESGDSRRTPTQRQLLAGQSAAHFAAATAKATIQQNEDSDWVQEKVRDGLESDWERQARLEYEAAVAEAELQAGYPQGGESK